MQDHPNLFAAWCVPIAAIRPRPNASYGQHCAGESSATYVSAVSIRLPATSSTSTAPKRSWQSRSTAAYMKGRRLGLAMPHAQQHWRHTAYVSSGSPMTTSSASCLFCWMQLRVRYLAEDLTPDPSQIQNLTPDPSPFVGSTHRATFAAFGRRTERGCRVPPDFVRSNGDGLPELVQVQAEHRRSPCVRLRHPTAPLRGDSAFTAYARRRTCTAESPWRGEGVRFLLSPYTDRPHSPQPWPRRSNAAYSASRVDASSTTLCILCLFAQPPTAAQWCGSDQAPWAEQQSAQAAVASPAQQEYWSALPSSWASPAAAPSASG